MLDMRSAIIVVYALWQLAIVYLFQAEVVSSLKDLREEWKKPRKNPARITVYVIDDV